MIAELIPAWTAFAIRFHTLKEILCGYHDAIFDAGRLGSWYQLKHVGARTHPQRMRQPGPVHAYLQADSAAGSDQGGQ